jgi:nonsense-mediated mRNA decay protein 3
MKNYFRRCVFVCFETAQLLGICLKKITGLNKVKLVDAVWVWTEPHSKRLKIRLTVEKEVFSNAIVQKKFIVEYIIRVTMFSVFFFL